MENAKRWMSYLFSLLKGAFFLVFGLLCLTLAVFIVMLNYFYSQATATITSVDYQMWRKCPISKVVFEAGDGRKINAYISAEESCTDTQHPQAGDSVQIVYHPWLPYPNASLKSDFGANSDSLDPSTAWLGAAMAAFWGLACILKGWDGLRIPPPIRTRPWRD